VWFGLVITGLVAIGNCSDTGHASPGLSCVEKKNKNNQFSSSHSLKWANDWTGLDLKALSLTSLGISLCSSLIGCGVWYCSDNGC
jgi:hypothetical protein